MNGSKSTFDGNTREMMSYYRQYFGSKFWDHLIIIFCETILKGFQGIFENHLILPQQIQIR